MVNMDDPEVSVICTTYNNALYICECLNGILQQRVDFSYEVLIHDDASTDGTETIIQQYEKNNGNVIKAMYQRENQYSKGVDIWSTYEIPRIQGKYTAICEGDDYWTDPDKLRKQVNFLENHKEYGMVYSRARNYIQESGRLGKVWGGPSTQFQELIRGNQIPTVSTLIRTELLVKYYDDIKPWKKKWKMSDYPIWLWFACNSRIYFSRDVTCVYRVLTESASHSRSIQKSMDFLNSYFDIIRYYCNQYDKTKLFDIEWQQKEASLTCALKHGDYSYARKFSKEAKKGRKNYKLAVKLFIASAPIFIKLFNAIRHPFL